MTTDLSKLTAAAAKWDDMAGEFKKLEDQYQRDVHGVTLGPSWQGQSAQAANARFDTALHEFQAAQKEAKAIASLLRDAHDQFTELRGKVEAARADAIKAGMRVSDQGAVQFDYARADEATRRAAQHDPGLRDAEASWAAHIRQAVKAVSDADAGVKIALEAVVIDADTRDGSLNGFNAYAKGDVEKYEALELKEIATRINSGDATGQDLKEAQRAFRDNSGNKEFSQTLLSSLGPANTIRFTNKLNDLAYLDDKGHKRDYLSLQKSLATALATATQDPKSKFYKDFRADLQKAGIQKYEFDVAGERIHSAGHGQQVRGYQSLITLMQHGKGYSGQFLGDLTDDMIAAEKKDKNIWDLHGRFEGKHDGWFANDPIDGALGLMSHDPDTATGFLDPKADGGNDRLQHLIRERDWDTTNTTRWSGNVELPTDDVADKDARKGLGAALEAAATGHTPGSEHALGGHTLAQARVMNETIGQLNAEGIAEKLPENLRQPMANMLADYTPDTHQILASDNLTYKDRVWDDDGTVKMGVPHEELVKVMRGVASDPEAFGHMYRAEKQYALDVFAGMPDDHTSLTTQNRIHEAAAAIGAYDGVRTDTVFDKRFEATQWSNDFNAHVTRTSGAALNFVSPGAAIPADFANRILDYTLYEATKDRIAEANLEATKGNAKLFMAGQTEVDEMVGAWAKSNGHELDSEFTKHFVGEGQNDHATARHRALILLRPDY
ncbi:WXG100 family type VII secretion target [Streptomyces monticola]|uniref:WXG100 family type VII secretion target n=1 Tax=Streptomyces monticola TaxID=2666263 RepID=A0ABW2JCF1_9ACTN